MDPVQGEDLGFGVRATPSVGDEVIVTSQRFDLGWQIPQGQTPGSAILWRERSYEVVSREPTGSGSRWTLRLWPETVTMRVVLSLDAGMVKRQAEADAAERSGGHNRTWARLLLPFAVMAPAALQRQWRNDWAFPAETATWMSAITEVVVGMLGTVQLILLAWGGGWFLPGWLRWLTAVGFIFLVSGFIRLTLVAGHGEPVGSILGLPLTLLVRGPDPQADSVAPDVRRFEETEGTLELTSPIHRRDWDHDGRLRYRGDFYRLQVVSQEGRQWVYLFTRDRAGPADLGPELRLAPPSSAPYEPPSARKAPPSILRTTIITACVTLGPWPDQERWAEHLDVRPIWLTVAGAVAELLGGFVNLGNDAGRGVPVLLLLDFFLIGEGLLRLAALATGRPIASVFGLLLRPLYLRWLPPQT